MAKKRKTSKNIVKDLLLIFKYAKIYVDANPAVFDKQQQLMIRSIANQSAKEVYIDKTYVSYKDTKYEKTFISEEGWNELSELIRATNYGKNATNDQNQLMQDSYKAILVQYVYQFLDDLGYDISNIFIDILENTKFMVQIYESEQSDNYPGKWQTWECNQ